MEKQATPVVKNKYWIVSQGDQKIGTIQAIDEMNGDVVFVHDAKRERFANVKTLAQKYNIKFSSSDKKSNTGEYDVYGYPSCYKPYNQMFEVQKKLPMFTKTEKSKSYYCAGYYLVKYSGTWVDEMCPKSITLNRYEFLGPFTSKEEARASVR